MTAGQLQGGVIIFHIKTVKNGERDVGIALNAYLIGKVFFMIIVIKIGKQKKIYTNKLMI